MGSVARWWNACLHTGSLAYGAEWSDGAPAEAPKSDVYAAYAAYTVYGKENDVHFWRKLRQMASFTTDRRAGVGFGAASARCVQFGPLAACKADFRAFVRIPEWTF